MPTNYTVALLATYFLSNLLATWLTLCDPVTIYSPWHSLGQNTGVGCLSLLQGIFLGQEDSLEWVACPFSRESS